MNAAAALVEMIELSRSYEMQVRAMHTADENDAAAARLMRPAAERRPAQLTAGVIDMEALWVAKTGLDAQQTRMTVVSNNLANVNTNGFKKGRAIFEDLLYQNVSQAGGATSQDTEQPDGPQSRHRRARGRHREDLHPGRRRSTRAIPST